MNIIKNLHFALLTVISLSSMSVMASDLCQDAELLICTQTKNDRQNSKTYLAKLKQDIQKEAQSLALNKIKNKSRDDAQLIKNQITIKIAEKKLAHIDSAINNPTFKLKLEKYFQKSIMSSTLPAASKKEFIDRIAQIQIMNFSEYKDFKDLENDLEAQSMNPCENDGLAANAFSINHLGTLAVVVCPGYVIENSLDIDQTKLFSKLIFVLSHEMAHHLDTMYVDEINYKNYFHCIEKNYAQKLTPESEDKKLCQKQGFKSTACRKKVAASHIDEMIADVWAFKAVSEYIKENSLTNFEINSLLAHNLKKVCQSSDDGIHPAGSFRMTDSLLSAPEMLKSLGCAPSVTNAYPSCSF